MGKDSFNLGLCGEVKLYILKGVVRIYIEYLVKKIYISAQEFRRHTDLGRYLITYNIIFEITKKIWVMP